MADLPERLHEAAGAHRPDRERMLARVEHAMAASETPPGSPDPRAERPLSAPWMRITAAAAAVAGAIGLGGLAVGAVGNGGDREPASRTVATSGGARTTRPQSTAPSGAARPSGTAISPASSHPGSPLPAAGARTAGHHKATGKPAGNAPAAPAGRTAAQTPRTPPPSPAHTGRPGTGGITPTSAPPPQAGYMSCVATLDASSNASWTQEDLVLTTREKVTSLTVELRVAGGDGVAGTGSWTSVPALTAASMTVQGGDLVYRWTLDGGQALPPGSQTFSAQFQHARGRRDPRGDQFTVTAQGPAGPAATGGGF